MPYWIAMDTSKDPNHNSIVLGIFTDRKAAEAVADDHERRFHAHYDEKGHPCWWMRSFEVFEVGGLDRADRIDYESRDPWRDRLLAYVREGTSMVRSKPTSPS